MKRVRPAFVAALIFPLVTMLAVLEARAAVPVKVLLIGDSLSVSGFGEAMQEALIRRYGDDRVAVFASCGSSPEDWIKGGFVTHCGYRQKTPGRPVLLRDRERVTTPRLRTVLGRLRPEFVIVQLGTNWMDALRETARPEAAAYRRIIRDFVRELRRANPAVAIFWVLPPASSAYPPAVHAQVERWINEESVASGFYTINSRPFTSPYRPGVTGGDGVHYRKAAAGRWARGVLDKFLASVRTLTLAPPATAP